MLLTTHINEPHQVAANGKRIEDSQIAMAKILMDILDYGADLNDLPR